MILYLDANNSKSYSETGTTIWYNLVKLTNGTLVNSPTFSTTAQKCFVFNGTNQYMTVAAFDELNAISASTEFTFSCMFKILAYPASANSSNMTSLLMKNSFNPSFGMNIQYDNQVDGFFTRARGYYGIRNLALSSTASGYGIIALETNTILSLNTWYNLDMTQSFTGSSHNIRIYINGALDRSYTANNGNYPISTSGNYALFSGSTNILSGNGIYSNISVAQYKVYNRVLTDDEIVKNFLATSNVYKD